MVEYLPIILAVGALVTGLIWLWDALFFARKRRHFAGMRGEKHKEPILVEYSRSFFPVLLLVFIIRSFIVQPYVVPSGSLEPTILPGDFVVVSQFSYGLRLPVLRKKIVAVGEPKRGDIALFHWPANPKILFIKRVVGVPGDHLVYKNKVLTINGRRAVQKTLAPYAKTREGIDVFRKEENLLGIQHEILVQKHGGEQEDFSVTVPKGHYFMMGDNRDDSDDSRFWGMVPERDLVGKGQMIWMSWNGPERQVRWSRIGNIL